MLETDGPQSQVNASPENNPVGYYAIELLVLSDSPCVEGDYPGEFCLLRCPDLSFSRGCQRGRLSLYLHPVF